MNIDLLLSLFGLSLPISLRVLSYLFFGRW